MKVSTHVRKCALEYNAFPSFFLELSQEGGTLYVDEGAIYRGRRR